MRVGAVDFSACFRCLLLMDVCLLSSFFALTLRAPGCFVRPGNHDDLGVALIKREFLGVRRAIACKRSATALGPSRQDLSYGFDYF